MLYPLCEIINLQLWQKLFCEPELTYLEKIGRHETSSSGACVNAGHNFNDSLDGIHNGSSPLDQQIKQIIQDEFELEMKLNNNNNLHESSLPSIQNALNLAASTDPMHVSMTRLSARSSTSTGNNGAPIKSKQRSYDDLSKLDVNSNKFKFEFDNNLEREYHYKTAHKESSSQRYIYSFF